MIAENCDVPHNFFRLTEVLYSGNRVIIYTQFLRLGVIVIIWEGWLIFPPCTNTQNNHIFH